MPDPILLTVEPPAVVIHTSYGAADWGLADILSRAALHPGDYTLALRVGRHAIALGEQWTVDPTRELAAALEEFGRVEVLDLPPSPHRGQDHDEAGGSGPAGHVHIPRPVKEVDRDGDD